MLFILSNIFSFFVPSRKKHHFTWMTIYYTPEIQHKTWKWWIGRWCSFSMDVFSGSILIFRGCSHTLQTNQDITMTAPTGWKSLLRWPTWSSGCRIQVFCCSLNGGGWKWMFLFGERMLSFQIIHPQKKQISVFRIYKLLWKSITLWKPETQSLDLFLYLHICPSCFGDDYLLVQN